MAADWTKHEIELILDDYFQMFELEINGNSYSKTQFRRKLLPKLNGRSEGSIEFKHQNISAVLNHYGIPYIVGYKPRGKYQQLLEESTIEYLVRQKRLDRLFESFISDQAIVSPYQGLRFDQLQVAPPEGSLIEEPRVSYRARLRKPNYRHARRHHHRRRVA
ncbi:MAG: hypothetical protein AAF206_02520, partial [Bacteroidota bacterium]